MLCPKFKVLLGVCALVLLAGVANAGYIGTYVDADSSNTTPAFSVGESDTDNLWALDASRTFAGNGNVIVAQTDSEDPPMLTTTVAGLANGSYDVYAVYWMHTNGQFWCVDAALAGGSTVVCDSSGILTGNLGDDDKAQYSILLGQATVTDGSFAVNVFEHAGASRGWYDGVSYVAQEVPEPSTMVLVVAGLCGLLAYAWRKQK
jgi:hypothetical protein